MTTSMNGGGGQARGGCLTVFLILMLIANPLTAVSYFVMGDSIRQALHAPEWVAPVLGIGALINTACAVAVWKWKRWGVYGFLTLSVLVLGINISIGINPAQIVLGLAGPVILVALITRLWPQFR